jgi:hypothetical protein
VTRTSGLAWLRDIPETPGADNLHTILERRRVVQALALPTSLGKSIHPARFKTFAREGAVAPAFLLSSFDKRLRHAILAAQVAALEVRLADAAITMFEKLIGALSHAPNVATRWRRRHPASPTPSSPGQRCDICGPRPIATPWRASSTRTMLTSSSKFGARSTTRPPTGSSFHPGADQRRSMRSTAPTRV